MTTVPTWLGTALVILLGAAVVVVLGRGLAAAERRGWVRLHGTGKGSAAVAFAAMEDMFSGSRSQARQLSEEQKRVGDRAPAPGDKLDDGPSVTGRYAGRVTIPVRSAQTAGPRKPSGDAGAARGSSPHVPDHP